MLSNFMILNMLCEKFIIKKKTEIFVLKQIEKEVRLTR